MFVAKYTLPGKNNLIQPNYKEKVYFGVAENLSKDPLPMKITQITQSFRKNTGKLKGTTLFQK